MQLDLDSIPFKDTRYPGVSIHFYYSDRDSGHAAVMIRMEPGCSYPRHRHNGPEELLVLQGGYRDRFGEHGTGSYVRYEAGTSHAPVAVGDPDRPVDEGNPACVLFAIARGGIEILERTQAETLP